MGRPAPASAHERAGTAKRAAARKAKAAERRALDVLHRLCVRGSAVARTAEAHASFEPTQKLAARIAIEQPLLDMEVLSAAAGIDHHPAPATGEDELAEERGPVLERRFLQRIANDHEEALAELAKLRRRLRGEVAALVDRSVPSLRSQQRTASWLLRRYLPQARRR